MQFLTVMILCSVLALTCYADTDKGTPLACNLKAISAAERPRYKELVKRLRASVNERSELADGYKYKLDARAINLVEIAEWIGMERLCCPFLAFQVDVTSKGDPYLTLRGPSGAKAIIQEEFPLPR